MLAPMTWMASFTVAVVVLKWIIIGRYKPGDDAMWSGYFYRWWLVDRLMAVWETFVGYHLLSTPYLCDFVTSYWAVPNAH